MFGNDSDGNAHDDFHILDVSNWAWQASFSLTQASNISQPNNSTDFGSGSSDSKALSGGAIAGIVIGCLAAASDRSIIFYSFRQDYMGLQNIQYLGYYRWKIDSIFHAT